MFAKNKSKVFEFEKMIPRAKKKRDEKDRRKSQKFLPLALFLVSPLYNLSLSKSVWRRSRCSLLARFCPSLFTAYFEHRRRESERVGSFFDRNEIIHLPFGMKDDDKEEEIFLSSV